MDYETARNFLMQQGNPDQSDRDTLLIRLGQGYPPSPGQVTTTLLALNVVFEALQETDILERQLAYALHRLATESRQHYQLGQTRGIEWPTTLDADLSQIAIGIRRIFSGKDEE